MATRTFISGAVLRHWMIAIVLFVPVQAMAQLAHTIQSVNVRAGPDAMFPIVTWLPANEPLRVVGCTEGSRWCDIVAGRARGWINAKYLSDRARNRTVPIVTFDLAAYWDAHYRRRSWAADQAQWVDWNKPGFAPPPPGSRLSLRPSTRAP